MHYENGLATQDHAGEAAVCATANALNLLKRERERMRDFDPIEEALIQQAATDCLDMLNAYSDKHDQQLRASGVTKFIKSGGNTFRLTLRFMEEPKPIPFEAYLEHCQKLMFDAGVADPQAAITAAKEMHRIKAVIPE